MLRLVEIPLIMPEGVRVHSSMGSVLHGALMEIVGPEVAEQLHNGEATRPFTQCVYFDKAAGQAVWRLSALSAAADELILEPLLEQCGKEIFLAKKNYALGMGPLRRDVKSSCEELADEAFLGPCPRGASLSFLTTASFKREGSYVLWPEPGLIVQSLLRRWNSYSVKNRLEGEELSAELAAGLRLKKYQLRSQPFSLEGKTFYGFGGQLEYAFKANEMTCRIFGMLFAFAPYAGLGIKTALGMGGVTGTIYTQSAEKGEV